MGYDPNEARDEAGRWTSGGAAGGGGAKLAQRAKDVAATGTVKTAPGSDGPSATKAPVLTDWQIAAMRPDNTEVANAEARWRLDETQPGRDLMEVAADFQMTMTGYYDVQDDARKLLDGKSTGNPERDRQIRPASFRRTPSRRPCTGAWESTTSIPSSRSTRRAPPWSWVPRRSVRSSTWPADSPAPTTKAAAANTP
jgi:hypothetical protein